MRKNLVSLVACSVAALMPAVALAGFPFKFWDGGAGDGLWTSASNWDVNSVPVAGDDVILDHSFVAGAYTVTLGASSTANCRSLTVGSGSGNKITFRLTSDAATAMTIAGDGAGGAIDFLIRNQGEFINESAHASSATYLNNTASNNTAKVQNGGRFVQNTQRDFGTPFPATGNGAITFESASTLEWGQNSVGSAPMGGRTYGNLSFTSTSTKAYTYSFVDPGTGTVAGAFTLGPGTTTLWGDGTSGNKIVHTGSIVNNGVTLTFTGAATATSGVHIAGAPTIIGGTGVTRTGGAGDDLTIDSGGELEVASGHTILQQVAAVVGAGKFTLDAGAGLTITNLAGLNGMIQTTTKSFDNGANYTFSTVSGSVVTGTFFPSIVNNLDVSVFILGGTLTNSQALTVNGTLNLTAGRVVTDNVKTLSVASTASVSRTAGFVSGDGYKRQFNAAGTGPRVFDVGTATAYAPVTIDVTGGSGTGTFTLFTVDGDHPNVTDGSTTLDRFWTLSPAGFTGLTANLAFTYPQGDVDGSEASYTIGRHVGGAVWQVFTPTTLDTTNNIATINGISTFSDWTLGEAGGVPVAVSAFAIE